jgi:hypothetical protein
MHSTGYLVQVSKGTSLYRTLTVAIKVFYQLLAIKKSFRGFPTREIISYHEYILKYGVYLNENHLRKALT